MMTLPDSSAETVKILKDQCAQLEAKVEARREAFIEAGVGIQEPPCSAVAFETLVEALFGDDDNPQRITFDMRVHSHRLRLMEAVDLEKAKAEHAKQMDKIATAGTN